MSNEKKPKNKLFFISAVTGLVHRQMYTIAESSKEAKQQYLDEYGGLKADVSAIKIKTKYKGLCKNLIIEKSIA